MSTNQVDSRVVEMKFQNNQFESGVQATLHLLDTLKSKLNFDGASKSIETLGNTSKHFSMQGMANNVETVANKFRTLGIVGVAAITNLTQRAVGVGLQLSKAFTIAPITSGFGEYELKLGSIQTILANTARYGTKLPEVNAALDELNHYADKTIYDFGQMTTSVGLFTNAGLTLKDSVAMIKGFSNAAAASGTSAENAARASVQLSQALNQGTIRAMDWFSITNAGMGNKNMQEGLIEIAGAMGTLKKAGTSATDILKTGFKQSLEKGWLTADVMSKYLRIMAGDMTDAQIAALGLSDAEVKTFRQQQRTAEEAATKVRTLKQLLGTMKEAIGSGWSDTFETIFGGFNEATDLFTNVNNVLGGFIQTSADTRNKVLGDWKALGGRTMLINGIGEAFRNVMAILKPIRDAFRDIFPKKTGEDLAVMSYHFRQLAEALKPSKETVDHLRRTFRGLFAVLDIAKQIIGGVIDGFVHLFHAVGGGDGSFLSLTARIGDFLVSIDKMLKSSGLIQAFFTVLANIISYPVKLISEFATAVGKLFDGFDPKGSSKMNDALDGIAQRLSPLERLAKGIKIVFQALGHVLSGIGDVIGKTFVRIGKFMADHFSAAGFKSVLDAINTGLFAAIVLSFKKFMSGGLVGIATGSGGGIFGQVQQALSATTNTLKIMQQSLKAKMLLNIAAALALLTASIVVLSMIDSKKLTKAMLAIGIGFGALQVALVSLNKAIGPMAAVKLPLITASLMALGGALLLMAFALKTLASIDVKDTGRSLLNMTAMLIIVSKAMKVLSKDSAGMIRAATALTILGVALNIMAVALKLFGTISWDEMAHGLTALAGALTIIIAAMHLMPKDMVLQAAAMNLIATAIAGMGAALLIFNTMSWDAMAHGLTALAGALVIIAGAMRLMPKDMLLQSAALVAVGVALNIIAGAIKIMATLSWEQIGKGLVTLGGALAILAVGLNLMTGTLLGAAALVVATAALAILTPILVTLGSLSWMTIIKGLTALAGVFTILGLAGLVLAPLVPVLLGLGAAMVLIGGGFALAGVGALALATAFGIIAAAGAAAVTVLGGVLKTFIDSIPAFMQSLAIGLVQIAQVIAKAEPQFAAAFVSIMNAILSTVMTTLPRMGVVFLQLINVGLAVITQAIPRMAIAGLQILLALLKAIRDKIPAMAQVAREIIVAYLQAIGRELPKIIDAGAKLIISFINGLSKAIDNNSEELGRAGGRLGVAIVKGMVKGIAGGVGEVADAAKDLAKHALSSVGGFLGIHSPSREFHKLGVYSSMGLAEGMSAYSNEVVNAAKDISSSAMHAIKTTMAHVGDAVSGDVDMRPVVAPVIDLTQFRKDATQMSGLMQVSPVQAKLSYAQASTISAQDQAATQAALQLATPTTTEPTVVKFEQNNYSPESLSTTEIYRQTKNQLSQVKQALDIPA